MQLPAFVTTLLEKADCFGSLTDEFISGVERQHGVTSPSEYRAFLRMRLMTPVLEPRAVT